MSQKSATVSTPGWYSFRLLSVASATMLALLVATTGIADDETDAAQVKYRQSLMDGVGADMAAISTILKNRLELPGHVEAHARKLAASAKLVSAAFKTEAPGHPTDAKGKIWKDWSGFEEKIAGFDAAANALATAAASGDHSAVGPAVQDLGKSCGGCHKPYRKPKEESFKNH